MLEIKDLCKSYGSKKVLKNINCKLSNGVYGLLGPNGAGKSTLMNIITTNLKADSGSILWNGKEINKLGNDYRGILGYMPQQQGLYNGFTGYMFLNYIAVLKDIPKNSMKDEIKRVTEAVNLTDNINKKIGTYSGGMKFDEPTAGLDPKERVRVKKMLSSLSKDKIIIVATHIVPDIENMAKDILVLKDGVLLKETESDKLIEQYTPNGNLEDVYMSIFAGDEKA